MIDLLIDYKKYRWFFTKSGKLVVGGKSAQQNEELLHHIVQTKEKYVMMHTREPGSPFCILIALPYSLVSSDYEECAIFTGCFSRAWRAGKKQAVIDIFYTLQLHKEEHMKIGTWSVKPPIEHRTVVLRLALTRQQKILRAVPPQTVQKRETLILLSPGKIDKRDMPAKLALELHTHFNNEDLLAAIPAGGSRICRP